MRPHPSVSHSIIGGRERSLLEWPYCWANDRNWPEPGLSVLDGPIFAVYF